MRETVEAALQPATDSRTPRKEPMLLAISVVLFGLWLIFLIATAVFSV
jgi:hypothetical protein